MHIRILLAVCSGVFLALSLICFNRARQLQTRLRACEMVISSNTMPNGVTMNPHTGEIIGTPTTSGIVKITVTDWCPKVKP